MKPFIRITEVWTPSSDGTLLEFGGGLFGHATNFATISRSLCFGRGEGLPGQAWDEGRPVLLKDFDSLHFRRSLAAKAAGLSCALAVPIFVGDTLTGVLVFFCGDEDAHAGAIELWRNDPRITSDMTLVDGYYGTTPEAFESISRETSLPRGGGLPGLAWQRGAAVLMDDLGASSRRFLRGDTAHEVGIDRGLALPCSTQTSQNYVIAFLSAASTPIAQRVESWAPDEAGTKLVRTSGYCEATGKLTGQAAVVMALDADNTSANVIAQSFLTGVPTFSEAAGSLPDGIGASARQTGLTSLVAIPVVADGKVSETVVLYF